MSRCLVILDYKMPFYNLMECLRVYESPYRKIRLGKKNDGGYIICDIDSNYDILLSGGIANDISFENALLEKYTQLRGVAFDGTITSCPRRTQNRLHFIKKNIGAIESETMTNLQEYFTQNNTIFMKMDIEGGEVALFSSLSDTDLLKIKQLVIEIHSATNFDIPTRLAKTHWLVHFHANNCCGTTIVDGIRVPKVFECTYIRREPGDNFSLNKRPIPDPDLDQPNLVDKPEIELQGAPFVHT